MEQGLMEVVTEVRQVVITMAHQEMQILVAVVVDLLLAPEAVLLEVQVDQG
jgi:hypothetical protein